MKKVLITGAAGFVGGNLAHRLLQDGHELHLLVRPDSELWRLDDIRGHVRMHAIDIANCERVRSTIDRVRPDWVFHLAANGAYSWQTNPYEMIQTNIAGIVNLLESSARAGCESFVNTGSSSEYGLQDGAPSENEALAPNSYYAVTKAAATHVCRYIAAKTGMRVTTLRLYSAYGPLEDPRRLVPTLILKARQRQLPPLVNPSTARDYIYIADVVSAYLAVVGANLKESGAIFNVGSGQQTTIAKIVEEVRSMFRLNVEPQWGAMPDRIWDTSTWVCNNNKIRHEIGWAPTHSLKDGLKKFADWLESEDRLATYISKQNQPENSTTMDGKEKADISSESSFAPMQHVFPRLTEQERKDIIQG
jgi:dolichol-phosphate mannosyltransferase